MNDAVSTARDDLGERFDPFREPYLADPYPFFAEARAATPVFYSPALDYWIVTRYHDIRQVFQTPKLFSASNALAPIHPIGPEAARILAGGGFRPIPTLTNSDPPAHTRVRWLANVAFTPKRVAAMEPFVRDLVRRFVEQRLSDGRADLVDDLAWELPALVILQAPDRGRRHAPAGYRPIPRSALAESSPTFAVRLSSSSEEGPVTR